MHEVSSVVAMEPSQGYSAHVGLAMVMEAWPGFHFSSLFAACHRERAKRARAVLGSPTWRCSGPMVVVGLKFEPKALLLEWLVNSPLRKRPKGDIFPCRANAIKDYSKVVFAKGMIGAHRLSILPDQFFLRSRSRSRCGLRRLKQS